jgi:hypothetical protein
MQRIMKTSCIGLNTIRSCLLFVGIVAVTFNPSLRAHASTLDNIGLTLLRSVTTNLDGAGIRVAQPEASLSTNSPVFEVNPAAIGQPTSLFTYYSTNGMSTNYPNSVGEESSHANAVAAIMSGIPGGVATNVAHIDNYEADYFINTYIATLSPPDPGVPIVNQSFTFGELSTGNQQQVDQFYDNAAAAHGTLFISGADNSGTVKAPATCYNGIGVGVIDGGSGIGPTPDNGRSKPDLVGYGGFTSASTPLVAGSAALLLQAALRGDGGNSTNAAGDMRTLKALLLNGAIKPSGWTNGPSTPLDARYGAGIVNVFNSYQQLAGGQHPAIEQTSVGLGAAHPPGSSTANVAQWNGWNFDTSLSSTMTQERIKHYYFNLTNAATNATFTFTGTLVWNRQENQAAINDLDLLLYNTATSNVVAESTGFVNNVEHIYIRHLPPGRYDLQVWKAGGNAGNGRITNDETYALAWEFFAMPLHITPTGTNVVLTWPIYPTGFILESTASLSPANWSTNLPAPVVNNGTNQVTVSTANSATFFRLRRP